MIMTRNKIKEFERCLYQEKFYDAHEVLEEIWFPRRFEENSEVKLLKGFINAAVSFELLKRDRRQSAKKVWLNYLKYKQLLFKLKSPYLNEYYQLTRTLDKLHSKFQ
jgi:hypothetical protein